jgi:hypothetical protein
MSWIDSGHRVPHSKKNVCAYNNHAQTVTMTFRGGKRDRLFGSTAGEKGAAIMSVVFILFWITCGLFAVDVLLGKIGILTGGAVHQFLGDVPHFLLLAVAAALLTAESLRRETARNAMNRNNNPAINAESTKS